MYSMYEEIHVAGWPSFCLYRDMAYALGPEVNIDGASMMSESRRLSSFDAVSGL